VENFLLEYLLLMLNIIKCSSTPFVRTKLKDTAHVQWPTRNFSSAVTLVGSGNVPIRITEKWPNFAILHSVDIPNKGP